MTVLLYLSHYQIVLITEYVKDLIPVNEIRSHISKIIIGDKRISITEQ